MWLVDVATLELCNFIEGSIPPYVTLSHRWTTEELDFKEVFKRRINESKKGYQKLLNACQVAQSRGVGYVWIDTCCIDKRSSAELSEAINSMFQWYGKTESCVAYLEDVHAGFGFEEAFKASVWFTRAWTLQELLAPQEVHFYDKEWKHLGTRTALCGLIQEVTGIITDVLRKPQTIKSLSIAERMSWAADRVATRSEDMAYSLMGIFDVNMPPLYGEGKKAFLRLQEEILRRNSDTSIFLWGYNSITNSLLANSPADFRNSKGRRVTSIRPHVFKTNNIGVELENVDVFRWSLGIYGIALGVHGFNDKYALLISRTDLGAAFYRVGIALITESTIMTKRRNVLIAWKGYAGIRLPKHQDIIRAGHANSESCGFMIELEAGFPIFLGNLNYGRVCSTPQPFAHAPSGATNREEIHFDNLIMPGAVSFTTYLSGESQPIFFNLSFDYGSRACALVCPKKLATPAWRASDEVDNNSLGHNDNTMFKVSSGVREYDAYLFRTEGSLGYDEMPLPSTLSCGISGVLLRFVPPGFASNPSTLWKFTISRPLPGTAT